jgi:hypothetical protein
MAVKVMVAPAIANGEIEKPARAAVREAGKPDAKPKKRRRSSVFDADGNEVFITLVCLKCRKTRPLSQFGLRKMADGAIRNQPWCRTCRSGVGAEKPGRKASEGRSEPAAEVEAPPAARLEAAPETPPSRRPGSNMAAEVAAALAAGLRR